jgi:hypothetical protein
MRALRTLRTAGEGGGGWDRTVAPLADGIASRFGPLEMLDGDGRRATVNRMVPSDYNAPLEYGAGGNQRKKVVAVICRTLNRLVNERIQRDLLLPRASETPAPLGQAVQPDCAVTRQTAARKFLHLSQRAHWTLGALQLAMRDDVFGPLAESLRVAVREFYGLPRQ